MLVEDYFSSAYIANSVAPSFLIGLSVGYFFKKFLKIITIIMGATILMLFIAESNNIITINNDSIIESVSQVSGHLSNLAHSIQERLKGFITKGISATTGFLIGVKVG